MNGRSDGMLSSILDDYKELFDLEPFYKICFRSFFVEAEYQGIPKDFYWKYLEKIENMYLETTELNLKNKLDEFLDQHERYLKDLYL